MMNKLDIAEEMVSTLFQVNILTRGGQWHLAPRNECQFWTVIPGKTEYFSFPWGQYWLQIALDPWNKG